MGLRGSNGEKERGQLRFCCDFRYLNAVTIKDAYPIPRIDESLSKLGDAKFFTTLDLGSAFWQVPLRKKDREKNGFACELGLYRWKRTPFGLCNATATFQRLMAQALTRVTKMYGNSSTHEKEAYVGRETGTMDKFGVVTTISKEANTPGQSRGFAIMTNSEPQTGESRNRGLGNALANPEVDNEKTSRQRVKAQISTSTKLPGTDRVTPPLVTPLVDNGAALEEALNNIVDSLGEQNEQMSIRMNELERAVHIERESLREEINRNRQEVGRSEKRLKERTDEHRAKNLSRMTREAEQRELRLRDDMEKLRVQQEQSLVTLDTKIDAMMEKRTQAIMDRLDGLLSSKSGPKDGEPNSGGPSREPRVNFNAHQKRKTYGSTRGRGSSSGYATRGNGTWGPNSRASSTRSRQTSNERPTQGTHATGRSDSGNEGHASPGRSHVGQAGNTHGDSDCRDAPHTEPLTRCEDTQAGH